MAQEPDFDLIDALVHHRNQPRFPWSGATEDRWAAQDAIVTLYAALQLPKPRMVWCPSPAAMFRASRMLRTVQHGTAYSMCQALVPAGGDSIDREARISLLAALIDPDVSTQSGGLLINMIQNIFGRPGTSEVYSLACLLDIKARLQFQEQDPSGTVAPARFSEQTLWPVFYPGFNVPRLNPLMRQALIIMPFAKLCWLCRPPLFVKTDEFGYLHCATGPAAEWSDGFQVFCDRTPPEENAKLKAGEALALPAGEGNCGA